MKTALVTGAGRGIGLAAAHLFLQAGLRVLGLDKDFSKCDLPADARVPFDLQNLNEIPPLVKRLGDIDVLVNNAGTLYCHPHHAFPTSARWPPSPAIPTSGTALPRQLPESRKEAVRSVHSGRPARPEEVAQAIVRLGTASPAYLNGAALDINNGSYPR